MHSASGLQGCSCHPTGEASCCQKAQQQHGFQCTLHANGYNDDADDLSCALAALVAGVLKRRLQTCFGHCSHSALLGMNPAWHKEVALMCHTILPVVLRPQPLPISDESDDLSSAAAHL